MAYAIPMRLAIFSLIVFVGGGTVTMIALAPVVGVFSAIGVALGLGAVFVEVWREGRGRTG
jgi:hypothetical protein